MDSRCPSWSATAVPPTKPNLFEKDFTSGRSFNCSPVRISLCILLKIELKIIHNLRAIVYSRAVGVLMENFCDFSDAQERNQFSYIIHITVIQNPLNGGCVWQAVIISRWPKQILSFPYKITNSHSAIISKLWEGYALFLTKFATIFSVVIGSKRARGYAALNVKRRGVFFFPFAFNG